MRDRRFRIGSALFWICFVPYVIGVVVWLLVGLLPAVAHHSRSLHDLLHEQADDALKAGAPVTIHFEDRDDDEETRNLVLLRPDGELLYSGPYPHDVTALAPGSYRMVSGHDPDPLEGELRFAEEGADSVTIQVPKAGDRLVKVGTTGWAGVAQRVADASHEADGTARVALETIFGVFNLGLGILLVVRRPRDRTARLLAVGMIGTAATFHHQAHVVLNAYLLGDWWTPHLLFHIASGMAYMFAVIVFPDGRLVPFVRTTKSRVVLGLGYALAASGVAFLVQAQRGESHPGQTFFAALFGVAIPLVGVAAQTYRLRQAESSERHQQSLLLRSALLPTLAFAVVYLVVVGLFDALSDSGTTPDWVHDVALAILPALFALVPLALVMGILRYRLWEIDVLISKTLLYVGLVAFIAAVYVVVVVLLGHALGSGDSALKIIATAIAAVAFEPVRERLERVANRLVYGQRATPYEVVADFADRLSSAISVDEVLPRTAEALAAGVGAVASRATTFLPGGGERTATWPPGDATSTFTRALSVTYAGQRVGEIAVAKRAGQRLTPAEEGLLTSLGAQAGVAFNNARLTIELQDRLEEMSAQAADLRASRQRIVTARQRQRQRVVQIIHNRVERHLENADAQLVRAQQLLPDDPEQADLCFDALLSEGQESLDALRDLARGIFPAILADQGVVAALQAHLVQAHLPVDVEIDGDEGRFEPNAEASVYFCVVQALANAATYAAGSHVTLRLRARDDRLEFEVADDGPGADTTQLQEGADIRDMRDRVEAVGGRLEALSVEKRGTIVSGWVPARAPLRAGAPAGEAGRTTVEP